MKRILIILLLGFLFVSCDQVTEEEKQILVQNTKANLWDYLYGKNYKRGQPLPDDRAKWIPAMQEKWEYSKNRQRWSRKDEWFNIETLTLVSSGIGIESNEEGDKSYNYIDNPKYHLIYIGKWEYSPKLNKKIRLIAVQSKKYPEDLYPYLEEMDEKNKDIPTMELQIEKLPLKKIQEREPSGSYFSQIKWIDKYGYNKHYDFRNHKIVESPE